MRAAIAAFFLSLTILESRLIYKVSHSINKIQWLNITVENGGWVYIGNGEEMRKEFVISSINEFFVESSTLYISWTRNGSIGVVKDNINFAIKTILGFYDFSIWDADFKKVIEFNQNGVMRFGEVET